MTAKQKVQSMIDIANETTGESRTNLTVAIQDLVDGYGSGAELKIVVTAPTGSTVTANKGTTTITAEEVSGTWTFIVPEEGTWTINASLGEESTQDIVVVKSNYNSTIAYNHIYGVMWDGSSSTAWTRTDEAVDFESPNPYYAGMSGTPSSPFDNCYPWKDITEVEDEVLGTLIKIPKFWYKWTINGTVMKLQISSTALNGYLVSPAHMDREDSQGERDYVYVGKYACDSEYRSMPGKIKSSLASTIRATQRSQVSMFGTGVYMYDFAMLWTIGMLYLVEYADWNMRTKIGYGEGDYTTGDTNSISYHTGTTAMERTIAGLCKYRNIEGLWNDSYNLEGITNNGYAVYINKNPTLYAEGVTYGIQMSAWNCGGTTSTWTRGTTQGYEWVLFPSAINGNNANTYTCAKYAHDWISGWFGTVTGAVETSSLFTLHQWAKVDSWSNKARIQYLPPNNSN